MRLRPIFALFGLLFSLVTVPQFAAHGAAAQGDPACGAGGGHFFFQRSALGTGWAEQRTYNYDVFTGTTYHVNIYIPEYCTAGSVRQGVVYLQNSSDKSKKFFLAKSTQFVERIDQPMSNQKYSYYMSSTVFEINLKANALPSGRYDLVTEGFRADGRLSEGSESDCPKIFGNRCGWNRGPSNGITIKKDESSGPSNTLPPPPTWPMDPFVVTDSLSSPTGGNALDVRYIAQMGCGLKCKKLPARLSVRICKSGTSFTDRSCSAAVILKTTGSKNIKTSFGLTNYYSATSPQWKEKVSPGKYSAFIALPSSVRGSKTAKGIATLQWSANGPVVDPPTPPTTNPLRSCSWSFPSGGISVGSLAQEGMKVKARFTATSCYREPLPTKVVLTNTTTRKSVTMTPVESATTEFPAPSAGADPLGFQTVYDYEVGLSTKTLPRGKYVMHIYMPATLEDGHLLSMDSEKNRTVTVSYSKSATSTTTPAVTTTVPGSTPVTGTTVPGSTPVTGTTVPVTGTTVPSSGGSSGSTAVPTTAPIPDVSSVILTADEFRSGSSSDSMGNVLTTVTGTGTPLVVSYNVTLRCTPSCGALPDRIEAKICPGGPGYGYTNVACKPRQYMNAYTSTDSGYSRKYFHNYFDAGTLSGTWKVYLKVTIGSVVHYPTPIALLTRTK